MCAALFSVAFKISYYASALIFMLTLLGFVCFLPLLLGVL